MTNPFRPHESAGATFLPEDYVQRRAEMRANLISLFLFGVVMFAVIAAFFVTNRQWMTVRNEQRVINEQYALEAKKIEQLQEIERQKAEMLGKAEVTTALLEKVPRSVLLAELITRMPREITLLNLTLASKRLATEAKDTPAKGPGSISRTGQQRPGKPGAKGPPGTAPPPPEKPAVSAPRFDHTVSLQGIARVNNDITDYVAALNACTLLERVELAYIKTRRLDDKEYREFEITARIRPDADARSIDPVRPEDLERGAKSKDRGAPRGPVVREPEGALTAAPVPGGEE